MLYGEGKLVGRDMAPAIKIKIKIKISEVATKGGKVDADDLYERAVNPATTLKKDDGVAADKAAAPARFEQAAAIGYLGAAEQAARLRNADCLPLTPNGSRSAQNNACSWKKR